MGQATRRFDVKTKWMVEHGVRASKDFLTVEENSRLENYGEDTINNTGRSRPRSPKGLSSGMSRILFWGVLISLLLSSAQQSAAAETKLAWQMNKKTIDAAKKERKSSRGCRRARIEKISRRNFRQAFSRRGDRNGPRAVRPTPARSPRNMPPACAIMMF